MQGQEIDLSDGAGLLVKRIVKPGDGTLIELDTTAIVHYVGKFEVQHPCSFSAVPCVRCICDSPSGCD